MDELIHKKDENKKKLQETRSKVSDAEKSGTADLGDLKKALVSLEKEAEDIKKKNDDMQNKERVCF